MPRQETVIGAVPSELSAELRKVWAYVKKEFLIEKSYTFAYLFSILSVCTTITTYFFIDRLFGRQITSDLASFDTSYFAYVLVGNAFFAYVGTAIGGIAGGIGSEQTRGTLEVLLGTPTRLWVLLLAVAIWNTLYASIEVVLYFFVGAVGFDVSFNRINWSTLACFLALVIIVFKSMGLIEGIRRREGFKSMTSFFLGRRSASAPRGCESELGTEDGIDRDRGYSQGR